MRSSTSRVLLFATVTAALCLWGCVPQQPPVPTVNATVIPTAPPLTIMDGADFAIFSKRFLAELINRHILAPDGTPTPETPLMLHGTGLPKGEYLPESFGDVFYKRLSLRFMWPSEERDRVHESVTHSGMPSSGETVTVSESSLVVVGEFSTDIYTLVALLDWNRDGVRDWLVRYRFKASTDEQTSSRMLIINAPGPNGILDAEVIEAVECSAEGCKSYTGPALPEILGYDPTAPATSPHQVSSQEADGKTIQ